jgi:hypothetical protein
MIRERQEEIFSFHIGRSPVLAGTRLLYFPLHIKRVSGLLHSECLFTMRLGRSIVSPTRYNLRTLAYFAWWRDEIALNQFLEKPSHSMFKDGWHTRLKLYRKWGEIEELKSAVVNPQLADPSQPVVAVTLARLNLLQTPRFIKWGKPVEGQVRDHPGQLFAIAAMRPLRTFSTFSIWKSESDMLNMVTGRNKLTDGQSHSLAMQARTREDFHHGFTTLRFSPAQDLALGDLVDSLNKFGIQES